MTTFPIEHRLLPQGGRLGGGGARGGAEQGGQGMERSGEQGGDQRVRWQLLSSGQGVGTAMGA